MASLCHTAFFATVLVCFLLTFRSGIDAVTPSARSSSVESFKVMDIMATAHEMEANGEEVIHLEVGQPSSAAPSKVLDAAAKILQMDRIGYTSAVGVEALRARIAQHYAEEYQVHVNKERIIIATGSSAAFLFAFLGCFDQGSYVAVCSSGYPCYRNDIKALGLIEASIPVHKLTYKVTRVELEAEIERRKAANLPPLSGFICSSPSNPTGAMLTADELRDICACCDKNGIVFLSDEIYHGITYMGKKCSTAIEYSENAISINSFSKFYSMTGWRLGWMVVPPNMVDTMNRLSQNLYINAPTLSQLAGVHAFDCKEELNAHVKRYSENRRVVLETLSELGLLTDAAPADGGFYIYVDLLKAGIGRGEGCMMDAPKLCNRLLREAKVAVTPGLDFESSESGLGFQRVRLSYSRSTEEVTEGMRRLKLWWQQNMQSSSRE